MPRNTQLFNQSRMKKSTSNLPVTIALKYGSLNGFVFIFGMSTNYRRKIAFRRHKVLTQSFRFRDVFESVSPLERKPDNTLQEISQSPDNVVDSIDSHSDDLYNLLGYVVVVAQTACK